MCSHSSMQQFTNHSLTHHLLVQPLTDTATHPCSHPLTQPPVDAASFWQPSTDIATGTPWSSDCMQTTLRTVCRLQIYGAKGVLVHMPGTNGVGLRPSMMKFRSSYPVLEVLNSLCVSAVSHSAVAGVRGWPSTRWCRTSEDKKE